MKWYGEPIEKPRTDDTSETSSVNLFNDHRVEVVDIHKIIDDAMEKGDRSVYILIHNGGMSVTINPYMEEKPKWFDFGYGNLKCSDCGHYQHINLGHDKVPTYCGYCGEKMHGIIKKDIDDEEEET